MSEVLIGWAIWIKPAQCSELKASKQSYISQVCTINTLIINFGIYNIVKKVHFQDKVVNFLTFMLIKFLVRTLQCTETLI